MKRLLTYILLLAFASCASKTPKEDFDTYLSQGRLKEALKVYATWGFDPQTQFEMGFVKVIESFRTFSVTLLSYVKKDARKDLPFALSQEPKPITYDQLMGTFSGLRDNLREAAVNLENGGSGDWKSVFRPQMIHLDLNDDGKLESSEVTGELFSFGVSRAMQGSAVNTQEKFEIAADAADSLWLAGYCHLIASFLDTFLIYDWHPIYDQFASEVFENVQDKHPVTQPIFAEVINVKDKQLGESARRGYLKVLDLNQATIAALNKETDNDREWIPSASQNSVTGLAIDATLWQQWKEFSAVFRSILEGQVFVDFDGSSKAGKGLNIKKMFDDPPPLSFGAYNVIRAKYVEAAPAEKIIDENNAFFRFLEGNGMMYAFFIN